MEKDATYIYVVARLAKKNKIDREKALDMIINRILLLWNAGAKPEINENVAHRIL